MMISESLGDTLREGIEKLAELSESPTQRQAALIAQLEKNSSGDYVPPDVPPPAPRATSVTQSPVKKGQSTIEVMMLDSYAPDENFKAQTPNLLCGEEKAVYIVVLFEFKCV